MDSFDYSFEESFLFSTHPTSLHNSSSASSSHLNHKPSTTSYISDHHVTHHHVHHDDFHRHAYFAATALLSDPFALDHSVSSAAHDDEQPHPQVMSPMTSFNTVDEQATSQMNMNGQAAQQHSSPVSSVLEMIQSSSPSSSVSSLPSAPVSPLQVINQANSGMNGGHDQKMIKTQSSDALLDSIVVVIPDANSAVNTNNHNGNNTSPLNLTIVNSFDASLNKEQKKKEKKRKSTPYNSEIIILPHPACLASPEQVVSDSATSFEKKDKKDKKKKLRKEFMLMNNMSAHGVVESVHTTPVHSTIISPEDNQNMSHDNKSMPAMNLSGLEQTSTISSIPTSHRNGRYTLPGHITSQADMNMKNIYEQTRLSVKSLHQSPEQAYEEFQHSRLSPTLAVSNSSASSTTDHSEQEDEQVDEHTRAARLARKAELARVARQKKKRKLQELEDEVKRLQDELELVKKQKQNLQNTIPLYSAAPESVSSVHQSEELSLEVQRCLSTFTTGCNEDGTYSSGMTESLATLLEAGSSLTAVHLHALQNLDLPSQSVQLKFLTWILNQNDKFVSDPNSLWSGLWTHELGASEAQQQQLSNLRRSVAEASDSSIINSKVDEKIKAFAQKHATRQQHVVACLRGVASILTEDQLRKLFAWAEKFAHICFNLKIN